MRISLTAVVICAALAGCSQSQSSVSTHWYGPTVLASVSVEDGTEAGLATKVIRTPHYEIYSTIPDRPDMVAKLGQLMEGAFDTYQVIAPSLPPTDHPMICHLFADRLQWEHYTRSHLPADAAAVYLKIGRGGYTVQDWYVAYFAGDIDTYSISAHEGWHQFCFRHFKGHLPPFLEEGLACMFENVEWKDNLPQWNLSLNPGRALYLRKAMDAGELFPLSKLVTLHAGNVIGYSDIKIQAFYAQDWAFARYLWEGENGKYRPALQRLIADTAAGTVADPTGSLRVKYLWNPAGVRPMLEHYLGEDLSVTEAGYKHFMEKIAYEEMNQQFQLP